jgi:hypothetical protein
MSPATKQSKKGLRHEAESTLSSNSSTAKKRKEKKKKVLKRPGSE